MTVVLFGAGCKPYLSAFLPWSGNNVCVVKSLIRCNQILLRTYNGRNQNCQNTSSASESCSPELQNQYTNYREEVSKEVPSVTTLVLTTFYIYSYNSSLVTFILSCLLLLKII